VATREERNGNGRQRAMVAGTGGGKTAAARVPPKKARRRERDTGTKPWETVRGSKTGARRVE